MSVTNTPRRLTSLYTPNQFPPPAFVCTETLDDMILPDIMSPKSHYETGSQFAFFGNINLGADTRRQLFMKPDYISIFEADLSP